MEQPLEFTIDTRDFDINLLDEDSREVGSERFANAVGLYFARQFEAIGGSVAVSVSSEDIAVSWTPEGTSRDLTVRALALLQVGKLDEAVPLLRILILARPDDDVALYNLGMAESDLGELDAAILHLTRSTVINPKDANALVGLSVAQQRSGDTEAAKRSLEQAVRIDASNGHAHLNLGAILGSTGQAEASMRHLREAARLMPADQRALYGLAYSLQQGDEPEQRTEADALYKQAIALDPQSEIAELARRARSGLAEKSFRAVANTPVRMDAVMYCLGALEKFSAMDNAKVQAVAFEIALLGQRGLDVNNPASRYTLRSLPGDFSGLNLMALMYVGFQQIAPDKDIGFDLTSEFATAEQMFAAQKSSA